jgi:hypothetical protein
MSIPSGTDELAPGTVDLPDGASRMVNLQTTRKGVTATMRKDRAPGRSGTFLVATSNQSPRGSVPVGQKDAADAAARRIASRTDSRIVKVNVPKRP